MILPFTNNKICDNIKVSSSKGEIKMEKVIKEVNCLNCGEKQEIKKDEIYQDIKGKFVVCKNCDSTFDIEE
jgi:transcription elongation factor Elf1